MVELRKCDFLLLRYALDLVMDEALSFGVILVERGWPERGEGFVRMAPEREWERMRRMAPQMDVAMLQGLGEELRRDFESGTLTREGIASLGELLHKVKETFSSQILVLGPKAVETIS